MAVSAGHKASGAAAADAAEYLSSYFSSSHIVVISDESGAGTDLLCLPMKSLDFPMS